MLYTNNENFSGKVTSVEQKTKITRKVEQFRFKELSNEMVS